jgi:hypothetical protein
MLKAKKQRFIVYILKPYLLFLARAQEWLNSGISKSQKTLAKVI